MKTLSKFLVVLAILAMVACVVMPSTVLASNAANNLNNINVVEPSQSDTNGFNDIVGKFLGFLQIASGILAVVMIAWKGFEYIFSSPELKTQAKKDMIPIVVGVMLVFGAISLARMIMGLF